MPSSEYDIGYLQAGVEILDKYLMSKEIYWPVGVKPPAGVPPYPQLTLGGLLLAQARLRSRPLSSTLQAIFTQLEIELDATHAHWRVAWESKSTYEFHARLILWRDFLEDYRANPDNNVDRYVYEVSRRVMLHLLTPDAIQVPQAEVRLLEGLDKILRVVFLPGDFVWDMEIAPGFPKQPYWYLYGQLSMDK